MLDNEKLIEERASFHPINAAQVKKLCLKFPENSLKMLFRSRLIWHLFMFFFLSCLDARFRHEHDS